MSQFKFNAAARSSDAQGKGASRRLRRQNLVPAIIYGGEGEPVSITLRLNELVKAIESDAFFASIIDVNIDGQSTEVIIKAMQRHPAKGIPMHVDFQRIVRGQLMTFSVPVHFTGKDEAQDACGGIFSSVVNEVELECMPRNLPEFVEVDASKLVVGDTLSAQDIKLPADVSLKSLDADTLIASMQAPIVESEVEAVEEAGMTDILDGLVAPDEVPATEQGSTTSE